MIYIIMFLFVFQSSVYASAPRHPSLWESVVPTYEPPRLRCSLPSRLDEDSLHFYDAVHFEPHLALNFVDHTLSGYVLVTVTSHDVSLSELDFRFTTSLSIDSVWTGDNQSASVQTVGNDSIRITLTPPLGVGDTTTIGVAFQGTPEIVDWWGGFHWADQSGWQPAIAYSMGDGISIDPPPANYTWFPNYADPNDKATWEAWFTVPTGKTVSSNGVRVDTLNNGDNTTWHYRLDQPVSTYLFFVSASDYVIQTQREANPLIENFVYTSRVTQAETHFSNVPTVLDSFVAWFGPYPFDRMGYNMTRQGDMEHATCVSHIDQYVLANHVNDWLLFHEMSHMWWGDWVTCGDWRDLWLNEGFATYCEALGMEALGGYDAYIEYIVNDLFQDARMTNENFPIYDPDYYWGATVYDKGGCVMHMLRYVLGDSAFFQAWREFGEEHAFATAVTDEWQTKLEEHYGASLDWFFDEWIYGYRYPRYRVTLLNSDIVQLHIEQIQTSETLFQMPLDLQFVNTEEETLEVTVWNNAEESQTWMVIPPLDSIDVGFPVSVELDPHDKILKTVVYEYINSIGHETQEPQEFTLSNAYPNPFNPTTNLNFTLPNPSFVTLSVFDLLGRQVERSSVGSFPAGTHLYSYDGSNLSSGVYLFRLESNAGVRTTKAVLLK